MLLITTFLTWQCTILTCLTSNISPLCQKIITQAAPILESYKAPRKPGKIAFLFLIRDSLNHENLWQSFLAGHKQQYSLYVHAKDRATTPFVASQVISQYRITDYGKVMSAVTALLRTALMDRQNEIFVLLSESTIPLQNFETIYKQLIGSTKSYFGYAPFLSGHGSGEWLDPIPHQKQIKNSGWPVLTRKHAWLFAHEQECLNIICKYSSDHEHYFGTLLNILGLLDEVDSRNKTFVDWTRSGGPCHPHTFDSLTPLDMALLAQQRNNGYLFARKFNSICDLRPIEHWITAQKKG